MARPKENAAAIEARNSLTESEEAAQQRRGRFMVRLNLVLGLVAALSTAGAFTVMFKRPYPPFVGIYLAADGKTLTQNQRALRGLAAPIRNTKSVASWAGRVATMAYTYDFSNFDARMNSLRGSFTAGGWAGFTAAQERNNLREVIMRSRFFYTASLANAPVITQQMVIGGVMTYQVEVPLNVTYYNTAGTIPKRFLINMTIEQVPTVDNPRGLGVVNFIEQSLTTMLTPG